MQNHFTTVKNCLNKKLLKKRTNTKYCRHCRKTVAINFIDVNLATRKPERRKDTKIHTSYLNCKILFLVVVKKYIFPFSFSMAISCIFSLVIFPVASNSSIMKALPCSIQDISSRAVELKILPFAQLGIVERCVGHGTCRLNFDAHRVECLSLLLIEEIFVH